MLPKFILKNLLSFNYNIYTWWYKLRNIKNLTILAVFLIISVTSIQAMVTVVPRAEESYTCYDYSVEYTKSHPDWICVTMSQNQWFRGTTHMVNCKLNSDGSLMIHDGLLKSDYTLYGWEDYQYYHFWYDKTPVRNYIVMQDNTAKFLEYSNIN